MNEIAREKEKEETLREEKSEREGGMIDVGVELRRQFIAWSLFSQG